MDVVRKIQAAPSSTTRTTNTEAQRLTPPIKIAQGGSRALGWWRYLPESCRWAFSIRMIENDVGFPRLSLERGARLKFRDFPSARDFHVKAADARSEESVGARLSQLRPARGETVAVRTLERHVPPAEWSTRPRTWRSAPASKLPLV